MALCYNNYVNIKADAFVGAKPELVLKTVFGYDEFRPFQKEIIEKILNGKDTMAIMPTGGGKSLCYQIPSLILPGITIVVTPLISLMQDQVSSLDASGVNAAFLNSTLSWQEFLDCMQEIKKGHIKIVYVSPEGLSSGKIRNFFIENEINVSCITVDEAHCISQWGHDFRPDYLEIAGFRNYFSDAPVLALTATATEQVRTDISKNLKLRNPSVFVSSFNRENIFLEVQNKHNPLDQVINCIKKYPGESGIIYCMSRKQVDELTNALDNLGYSVLNYHAGLSDDIRAKNQKLFIQDEVQIIVATVAFGMGINKPNVRYVINYDLPKSIEEYYQEIGRAGRDGLPSTALLLYSASDIHRIRYFFEDAADPAKSEVLLQGMIKYASVRECRRKNLLKYFAEDYTKKDDECCCDVCSSGSLPLVDVTTPVQKLLCCIIRTKERFGSAYVIDVLLGSRSKRILENGHNMISTWAIGRELSKNDWQNLVEVLISKDYLYRNGEYKILTITSEGKELLATREKVLLPIVLEGGSGQVAFPKKSDKEGSKKVEYIVHKKTEKIIAEQPLESDELAMKIITDLRAWRKRKADDLNVPPYIIFGDKTLLDLAAKKPKTKNELFDIYGLGTIKVDNFGNAIINTILDCTE